MDEHLQVKEIDRHGCVGFTFEASRPCDASDLEIPPVRTCSYHLE